MDHFFTPTTTVEFFDRAKFPFATARVNTGFPFFLSHPSPRFNKQHVIENMTHDLR